MKRTLQTILFALVAMMVPIGAWAQVTDAVAKVGDTEYADFAEALANWTDGTTLTLLADIPNETRATTIEIADKTVTLDLNGCTLDMSSVETAVEVKDGTLNICDSGENGTLKGGKYTVYTYYDAVLNVSDGCLTASRIAAYLNTGEFNISGGTLTSEYGIWNSYATVNISGSPTISGTRAALFNYNKMTISDTPVLCGGDYGDLYMEVPITLNTQPADGTWSVYMTRKNITTNNGVFALPGEGMTLDASKFTSMMDGYEVKLNTKGELLLCNHQTAYAAVSNEDGSTHRMLCYCGETIVEASVTCSGGMATCQDKAVCKHCGQSYGAVDPNVHTFGDDGKCGCGAERGEATTVDLSALTGTYVISDSEEYIFTGSGSYGIKVEKGNPRIVLNNASITVGEGSAIDVASGSNTTIFVLGDNTIGTTKTESWNEPCGGIFVTEGGTVNITSNGTNNILRAHGTLAAAIGGKYVYAEESYNAGNISISNVTVYAYTNNNYAAAIGAAGEGTCGTINITNAVVYAYGAGDRFTSAPGIGSAWSLTGWPETIPVVIISDSELHTFRYHSASDYIGYLGDVNGNVDGSTFATGSINCGDGGSVKNSTIYCYTGLDAITTDKVVKYGALGGLLKEDGTCEGEHSFTGNICDNCGYCPCTHEGSEHTCTDNGDGTHSFTCSICGEEVTEVHSSEKNEHKTTCQHGNICDLCGTEYGEPDPNAHTYNEEGKCSACGAYENIIDLSTLTETYIINDNKYHLFTGSGSYGIKVEKGNPRIVLNNANITLADGDYYENNPINGIHIASTVGTTIIYVMGNNSITAEAGAGIFAAEGSTVKIIGNSREDVLTTSGAEGGSGIGGYVFMNNNNDLVCCNSGNIEITNVTVKAFGSQSGLGDAAPAIGAAGNANCGYVTIDNAEVYAKGFISRHGGSSAIGTGADFITCQGGTIGEISIINNSNVYVTRGNYCDYIGISGHEFIPAEGIVNATAKNSTIYCYTGLDAITTDKVVKYGALGGLLKEDGTCEGEHTYANGVCENCGYCSCTHEGSEHTCTDNGDGTHSFTCSICGEEVTEVHSYTLTAESNMLTEVCACGHPNGTITIEAADKTYDGKAVEVVITKMGSLENADIPIAYTKDGEAFTGDPIEAGSYTATITMEEKSASVEFTIVQANVEAAEIALEYDETVYDGTEKMPAVTAVVVDGVAIDPASYDVTYSDNTAIGTATVTITFKGNYTGTVSTTFEILEDTTDVDMTTVGGGQATVIYDLTGRRVTKMEKGGIYIVDGKKVFLRK